MLVLLSSDYNKVKTEIDTVVGKTFTLVERKELGKTKYPDIPITFASIEIYNLLIMNQGQPTCTIELRPKGILISFRANQDTYALVIPNHRLRVNKAKAEEYSFQSSHHFIKIFVSKEDKELRSFIKTLRAHKISDTNTRIEDL